jgi:hypothetical protein
MAPPVVKSPIMLPYAGSSGMAGARQGDRARGGAVVDARHDVVLPPQGGPHGGGQAARGPRCDVQRSPLDVGFAHGASERSSALQRGAAGTSAAGALQEQPMGLAGKRRLSGGGVAPVGRKAKAAPPVLECESPQVGWPKHVEAAADGAKDAVVVTPQGVALAKGHAVTFAEWRVAPPEPVPAAGGMAAPEAGQDGDVAVEDAAPSWAPERTPRVREALRMAREAMRAYKPPPRLSSRLSSNRASRTTTSSCSGTGSASRAACTTDGLRATR